MPSVFEKPKTIPQARSYLCDIYMDWRNNYFTFEKFAEHNGITVLQAQNLIQVAQQVFNSEHPDA